MIKWIKQQLTKRAIAKYVRVAQERQAKIYSWRKNLKSGTRVVIFEEVALGEVVGKTGSILYFHPNLEAYAFRPDVGAAQKFYASDEFFPETEL